jgi:hypothetical protein
MSLVRRALFASALVCGALFAAGPVAIAQPMQLSAAADKNCSDFTYQEEAQAVLDADPSDPNNLDGNDNDGVACESLPHRPAGTSETTAPTETSQAPSGTEKPESTGKSESTGKPERTESSAPQVKVKPVGGVATGGGDVADPGNSGTFTALGGLVLLAIAAGAILVVRRRAGR